jgi:predicted HTH transcriptional regulator
LYNGYIKKKEVIGMVHIPKIVKLDQGLPASAKLLYGEMFNHMYDDGDEQYAMITNKQLAEMYGMKEDTVYRLLKKLKDRGYIKISDTPLKERKIYPLFNIYSQRARI